MHGVMTMPQFNPELVQIMRNVLDEVMTVVPLEISNTTTSPGFETAETVNIEFYILPF